MYKPKPMIMKKKKYAPRLSNKEVMAIALRDISAAKDFYRINYLIIESKVREFSNYDFQYVQI